MITHFHNKNVGQNTHTYLGNFALNGVRKRPTLSLNHNHNKQERILREKRGAVNEMLWSVVPDRTVYLIVIWVGPRTINPNHSSQ